MSNFAVVVRKTNGGEAIQQFQSMGLYDTSRRIQEHDADRLEIPVLKEPTSGPFTTVIQQSNPEPRLNELDDYLKQRGWSDEEVVNAPNSWSVIGEVVLVRVPDECPRPAEVGDALLELHGNADTVVARNGITGPFREPSIEVLAGSGDTETVHVENGTKYAMDLSAVMFSPGNKAERIRMGEVTSHGEQVVDMFAGIGYFTLPIARAGGIVTAIEKNPVAFQFLVENGVFNDVQGRVHPIRGDCRTVVPTLSARDQLVVDRIVMGNYDADEYLDSAFELVGAETMIHFHTIVPDPELWDEVIGHLTNAAEECEVSLTVCDRRRIKTHSPGMVHVVIDVKATNHT